MSQYAAFINQCESRDGVKFSWNAWPTSKIDDGRNIVPVGCLYTPIKEVHTQPVPYSPIICSRDSCKAIINPYCINSVDFRSLTWTCSICNQRNSFPKNYSAMTPEQLPAELQLTTMEYILKSNNNPPIFLIVLDTCLSPEEFKSVKESLQMALGFIPKDSLIGFISFGKMVYVHELVVKGMPKSWVFPGTKDYTSRLIQDLLGVGRGAVGSQGGPGQVQMNGRVPAGALPSNKFIQPLGECEMVLTDLLEELQADSWPVGQGRRPQRCVGAALQMAVSLLEATYPGTTARVMTFIGGPCTLGPGIIIDDDLKNAMRSHHDIDKDNCPYMKKAMKHYESLANRAAQNGYVMDLFSCSLDQTGLHEMRYLPNYTGGHMILADSFESQLFLQTFRRVFAMENFFRMDFNATIQAKMSPEIRVSGCIGPCFSCGSKGANVADTEVGIGKTNTWRVNGISPSTTLAFYFEVVGQHNAAAARQNNMGFVQFVTRYHHYSGQLRLRVTTVCRNLVDASSRSNDLIASFDQEAATVLVARMTVFQTESRESSEVLRWLDRQLIRLCQKFGEYSKDEPSSFRFPEEFSFYPQFMFHMRRSPFLQVFNNSPDETAYYRTMLSRESSSNCLLMIQPSLTSFKLDMTSEPVLLDCSSIEKNTILLMDSFFHILIYHGENIKNWIIQGYPNMPEYAGLKVFIERPQIEAQQLLRGRFPLPRYIETEFEGSQARFLLCKVNPSMTHNNTAFGFNQENGDGTVLTDDVSLQVFMDHLIKLAVSSSS